MVRGQALRIDSTLRHATRHHAAATIADLRVSTIRVQSANRLVLDRHTSSRAVDNHVVGTTAHHGAHWKGIDHGARLFR